MNTATVGPDAPALPDPSSGRTTPSGRETTIEPGPTVDASALSRATVDGDPERRGLADPSPRHPLLRRTVAGPLLLLLLVTSLPFIHWALRGPPPTPVQLPWGDTFDGALSSGAYFSTGGHWRTQDGWLFSPGVRNNPLWLRASLPPDAVVEFDARPGADGDVKCEIFGNGRDHASGYVLIHGGWKNTLTVLARLDEHGGDRLERRDLRVVQGQVYHWRIERQGGRLTWFIDDRLVFDWTDPRPLRGSGHDRFGLSSWDNEVWFDRLSVRPLPVLDGGVPSPGPPAAQGSRKVVGARNSTRGGSEGRVHPGGVPDAATHDAV